MMTERVAKSERVFSRFWLRRLSEASFFTSFLVMSMYAWARFAPIEHRFILGESVTDIAVFIAIITFILSAVLCLRPPHAHRFYLATSIYLMTIATIATLITTSGGIYSPFVSMWLMATVFTGIFTAWMTTGMALLLLLQLVLSYTEEPLSLEQIIITAILGAAPLLISVILWHRQPHKRVEEKFAELENKLTSAEGKADVVINAIDDGVMAISTAGIIELINPAAQQMIGWNQGDALGLSWQSVLRLVYNNGADVPEHDHPVVQALTRNRPTYSDKILLKTFSDKRRPITIVSSPVGEQDEGIIVVFRDISKEIEEEREQAEFISTASHEMRTPVASIEGYLGLALNPATAQIDNRARDFITKAHASAEHLGRLFQDLLDISKAEDGRLKDDPRVINVTEFVADIFEGLAHKAAQKGLTYSFRPHVLANNPSDQRLQPLYYIFTDPDHFREVIANLIENAIKYTKEGEIVVDVTGDPTTVVVSVADSGIGIPAEDIPHLFQKFYRVDNSETREIGGTGLGLYLVRRLVENMSGTIRVESEYGSGSTFFLEIPRLSKEEVAHKENETAQAAPITIAPAKPSVAESAAASDQPEPVTPPVQPSIPPPQAVAPPPNAPPQPPTTPSTSPPLRRVTIPQREETPKA